MQGFALYIAIKDSGYWVSNFWDSAPNLSSAGLVRTPMQPYMQRILQQLRAEHSSTLQQDRPTSQKATGEACNLNDLNLGVLTSSETHHTIPIPCTPQIRLSGCSRQDILREVSQESPLRPMKPKFEHQLKRRILDLENLPVH